MYFILSKYFLSNKSREPIAPFYLENSIDDIARNYIVHTTIPPKRRRKRRQKPIKSWIKKTATWRNGASHKPWCQSWETFPLGISQRRTIWVIASALDCLPESEGKTLLDKDTIWHGTWEIELELTWKPPSWSLSWY